jgi:hypothetical protein
MTDRSNSRTKIRRRRWTDAEDSVVRDLYGTTSAYTIAQQLDRTEDAVWIRAVKVLGLDKRGEVVPWTKVEMDDLRRSYQHEAPTAIAARLGRTPSAIYQQARCMGLISRKFMIVNATVHDYFSDVTTDEHAYILGLLAADGCVADEHPRIIFGLQEKDIHMVEFVRDRLNPEATISPATRKRRRFAVIQITSQQMVADVARYGIVPRKSRTLEWPALLPDSLLRSFLSGYFDGDGWIHTIHKGPYDYPGWGVCSGSERFLLDMKDFILKSTGITLPKVLHRRHSSLYHVGTSGAKAFGINDWLHQSGLGLERKRYASDLVARYRY